MQKDIRESIQEALGYDQFCTAQHAVRRLIQHYQALKDRPIDMLLFCPKCNAQHIDQPQPEKNWLNPPHRSHECQACRYVWRPSDVPTNGVTAIQTKGARDRDATPYPCMVGRLGSSIVLKDGTKVVLNRGPNASVAEVWLSVEPVAKIEAQG